MASKPPPSTPRAQIASAEFSTPSPGNWKHPKFEEIVQRKNAAAFDNSNVQKITWNTAALFLLWLDETLPRELSETLQAAMPISIPASWGTVRQLITLLLVWNIFTALMPFWRSQDNFDDIPLTPGQRKLLGLDPNTTTPATPDTQYVTPPRYSYSPGPRASSPANRKSNRSSSPGSRRNSPSALGQSSGSPYSPAASPLWQKAMGNRDQSRRHSYGSPSPLGPGTPSKEIGLLGHPNTPSPSTNRGVTVALNSKWLYERGRASPGSRNIYS